MEKETLSEAALKYSLEPQYFGKESGFRAGAKWQQEQDRWKTVSEKTPPNNIELLVQSPEGVVHLSNWRESYNIFTCQTKLESSYDWKWKTI